MKNTQELLHVRPFGGSVLMRTCVLIVVRELGHAEIMYVIVGLVLVDQTVQSKQEDEKKIIIIFFYKKYPIIMLLTVAIKIVALVSFVIFSGAATYYYMSNQTIEKDIAE